MNQYKVFLDGMSQPRVHAYATLFRPANDTELLGAYLWGQAISAGLQPFISVFEVAFRNAIHTSLSLTSSGYKNASYPWYDMTQPGALQLIGPTLDQVNDLLFASQVKGGARLVPAPSPDAVVSRLSFGVWPDILARQVPKSQLPRTFEDIFRQHPSSSRKHWSVPQNRHNVLLLCKNMQRLRNRVSHAEPIWKPSWLQNVQGKHWSHAVQGLQLFHKDMVELLGWISYPASEIYRQSFSRSWFVSLCTTNAVKAFMLDPLNTGHMAPIALPAVAAAPVPTAPPGSV
ncbi:hypothetical protein [Rhodoferax sp.]|jgi:hypothetical protein|uniref:hypothetical protein n=1 Tax=Rhodoferax sp. TaxID=50421 RepID=UPI002603A5AE|nr:hypothetical protein [Rhodoferax sp.]MDD3938054.1 hypothetical protein [Rhodoferax sp.]